MSDPAASDRAARIALEPLRPVGQRTGFVSGTVTSARELLAHRELLGLLVRRELRARYKNSTLGIAWSLIRPLTQLLIYYFAIGEILGLARQIPSFAIFVFVGLTAWTLFTEIVSTGTTSIISNAGLVKKVYLPREIFPLASVGGALFNFGVQSAILLAATVVFGEFPLSPDLIYAPLALLVILTFGTALALLLSAINVYLRDIQHLVEVAMVVLFWASPIVYGFSFVHSAIGDGPLMQAYLANPITLAVLGMQKALWLAGTTEAVIPNWPDDLGIRLLVALAASLVLLWISQRVFSRLQGNFAQEL